MGIDLPRRGPAGRSVWVLGSRRHGDADRPDFVFHLSRCCLSSRWSRVAARRLTESLASSAVMLAVHRHFRPNAWRTFAMELPIAVNRTLDFEAGQAIGSTYQWPGGQYCAIHTCMDWSAAASTTSARRTNSTWPWPLPAALRKNRCASPRICLTPRFWKSARRPRGWA